MKEIKIEIEDDGRSKISHVGFNPIEVITVLTQVIMTMLAKIKPVKQDMSMVKPVKPHILKVN